MLRPFSAVRNALRRYSVMLASALMASGLFTTAVISLHPGGLSGAGAGAAIGLSVALTALILFGITLTIRENQRLTKCAYNLRDVNYIYRQSLYHALSVTGNGLNPEEMLLIERDILSKVCHQIASIFSRCIGKDCVVTVKLLTREKVGGEERVPCCFTWARSEIAIERDHGEAPRLYAVEKNTAFGVALRRREAQPPHFFSADLGRLEREGRYANERPGWKRLYRSAIVVPIRHAPENIANDAVEDVIGFLCLDTRSTNRLNNTYHVHLLTSFADQMFNFLSLMRRRYATTDKSSRIET